MIYYPKRFLFVHVPKNAGSSMKRALIRGTEPRCAKGVSREMYRNMCKNLHNRDPLNEPLSYNIPIPPTQLIKFMNIKYETTFKEEDFFKFGVIRNPFDRAISIYHYIMDIDTVDSDHRWVQRGSKGKRGRLPRDFLIRSMLLKKITNFEEFVRFVFGSYTFSLFCMKYGGALHYVIKPQSYYLYNKENELLVDYMARYENLEEEWSFITNKIELDTKLPWINKSSRNHEKWEQYYTSEAKRIVREFFKRDFELLGY